MAIQCRNTRQIFTIPDPKQEEYKKRINVSFFFFFFFFLVAMNKALNSILDWLLERNILVQKCTDELFSNYTPDMYI